MEMERRRGLRLRRYGNWKAKAVRAAMSDIRSEERAAVSGRWRRNLGDGGLFWAGAASRNQFHQWALSVVNFLAGGFVCQDCAENGWDEGMFAGGDGIE